MEVTFTYVCNFRAAVQWKMRHIPPNVQRHFAKPHRVPVYHTAAEAHIKAKRNRTGPVVPGHVGSPWWAQQGEREGSVAALLQGKEGNSQGNEAWPWRQVEQLLTSCCIYWGDWDQVRVGGGQLLGWKPHRILYHRENGFIEQCLIYQDVYLNRKEYSCTLYNV